MVVPKVVFRYSPIYDEMCKGGEFKETRKGLGKYPSQKEIKIYMKKVEKIWRKEETKVLKELSKITKLKWKTKYIKCYVVGRVIPFSDPLSMPIYRKRTDYFIDVLIHELIHVLFVQNFKESDKAWKYIFRKYKEEAYTTKVHIPLHAFHTYIYFKFFKEENMRRDINICKKLKLKKYVRSWKIVEKEGYENIIKEFKKRLR